MTTGDRIISVLVLGTIAPIAGMLLFWWGSIPLFSDNSNVIPYLTAAGFIIGLLLDFSLLRRFVYKLFDLSLWALLMVEIFYSVLVYGFFMGFPVFNALVGILASCIVAKKCLILNANKEDAEKSMKYIIRASGVILFILCVCSAILALGEPSICSELKGMLGLSFNVTLSMVWGLIIIGGIILLLIQYLISKLIPARLLKTLK